MIPPGIRQSDPGNPSSTDTDSPWPGLASYTESQSRLFHGRDEEIRSLARLMERKALTVLFGQSGLGKSSLLQAGVFPRLRAASFCPIYIRLDHGDGAPMPTEQIKTMVAAASERVGTWTKPGVAKPGETLWEFFHHREDRLVDAAGRTITPVLVFDQFEELFTLGAAAGAQRDRAVAFMSELAELVENRPSEKLVERLELSAEEMDAFDFSRTDYRVCISLREDYLPHLEGLKTIMPALMENRMRLTRMSGAQALDAVLKPGGSLVNPEVAHAIVEFVSGARGGSIERLAEVDVEPPLLSVICRELNERRRAVGQPQITADLVSGNRREILTDFYERSVADLPADMRAFVEDHLLTKSGFRDNLALETALEFPGVTRPLIDTLVSRRLLRVEDRLGVQRVELTHDVLAEVIRASRDTRQQRLATEQLRERERITRRRMWLARTIAAGLLAGLTGVSWVAWRAIRAERQQSRLRTEADSARERETALRAEADAQKLIALRKAYASDMNALQNALANDNLGRARELLNRHRPAPGQIDLRGWEWRYLWQFCQSDAQSVLKQPDEILLLSMAASADGKWAAIGSFYSSGPSGRAVSIFHLPTGDVTSVPDTEGRARLAFSPREPLLAIAASGRGSAGPGSPYRDRIVIWDVSSRQAVRTLDLAGVCSGLSFSADGERLIAGSAVTGRPVGDISIWRVSDGVKLVSWEGGRHSTSTGSAQFAATADGSSAAVVTGANKLSVLDLKTGETRWTRVATDDAVKCLAFSPDGRVLVSGAGFFDPVIRIWDAATGNDLGRLEGHHGWVSRLEFLADGKRLVSSSADQTLRLWDLATRRSLRTFRGHKTEVHGFALLPDQRTLVSGCKDGSVFVWNLEREPGINSYGTFPAARGAWMLEGDGNTAVTVDYSGRVVRRAGRTFKDENVLLEIGALSSRYPIVISRTRPLLAAVTAAGKLQVWDWEHRALVREWEASNGSVRNVPYAFAANGTKLFVHAIEPPRISHREWDLSSGRESGSVDIPVPVGAVRRVFHSPDESRVVVLTPQPERSVAIDLQSGRPIQFNSNTVEVSAGPAFSPDNKLFVLPSQRSSYARILDAATFREVATLRGYMFGVHSAAFSGDMKRLAIGATGSEAFTLWDVHPYERLLTLPARAGMMGSMVFSNDGNVIAGQSFTSATDGTVHFWRAPSWAEIEKAEAADKAAQ